MIYPKEIKVGAHPYKIVVDEYKVYGDDRQTCVGMQSHADLTINLPTRLPQGGTKAESVLNQTLWHELLHAFNEVFSLELEEREIDCVSEGIVQVLNQEGFKLLRVE